MNKLIRRSVAGVGLVVLIGCVAGASAQDKEAAVKERQGFMKRQGADLKYISDFAKGVAGDQAGAIDKAKDLLAVDPRILDLFVPGTSSADFPGKSNAKPEIWTDWDKFKAIPPILQAAEMKLVDAVTSGDKAAIGGAIGNVGKNGCGACHSTFREKLPQ
jgi:cytochrome c556